MDREGSDQDVIIALLSHLTVLFPRKAGLPLTGAAVCLGCVRRECRRREPACLGAVLFCTLQRGPFQKRLPSRGFMDRHRTVSLQEQQSGLT